MYVCFFTSPKVLKKYIPVDPKQFFHIHCSICVHVYGYTSSWCWHLLAHLNREQHESQATCFSRYLGSMLVQLLRQGEDTEGEKNRDKDQSQMKSR